MKKVPSYPKITTKTNITFTQTQNININSPKSMAFSPNGLSSKKMFKAGSDNLNTASNKFSRDRQKSNNSQLAGKNISSANQKSKLKILSQKGSKSTKQLPLKRQYSTANLKLSKNYEPQHSIKNQETIKQTKSQGKQQIKKLQQKLKLLQKKIDTLKSSASKRKKQPSSSQRSHSKVKDHSMNNLPQSKPVLDYLRKKKPTTSDASSKILKKSYSDKNMLRCRPPKMPAKIHNQNSQNHHIKRHELEYQEGEDKKMRDHTSQNKQHPQQVIHKFVTQVQKNPKMFQRHFTSEQTTSKILYYITNLSLSLRNTDLMIYREHLIQSLQTFNYMQNVRKPSLKELEKHSVNLHHSDPKKFKYTIVLDLDETLIHCNESIDTPYDVSLKIKFPTGQKIDAGVNIRPHAHKLLKQLSQFCQVIVFTASHQCYANVVLDHLDPHKKMISHRLFRTHCWQTEEGIYIKDLRILKNRDLQNVLLVDNAAYSYFYQLQNGIPIIPFYDDKQDNELIYLIKYIKALIKAKQTHKINNTIKKANNSYFKLTEYLKFKDLQKLTKNLYETTMKDFEEFHE